MFTSKIDNKVHIKPNIYHIQYDKYNNIKAHIPYSTEFQHKAIGVVIGSKVKIGEHCKIWQNVTIGASRFGGGDYPTIEDYVFIYANSVIFGNITIGHHSVVAANTVVYKDVPPYSLVVGDCRILTGKYSK